MTALYCTLLNLTDRFGEPEITQASDKVGDGLLNLSAVNAAILDASTAIEQYIGSRYQLPLACTPDLILQIACDLARYHLHDDEATDQIRSNKNAANEQLKMIRERKIDLQADCDLVELSRSTVQVISRPQVFTSSLFDRMVF